MEYILAICVDILLIHFAPWVIIVDTRSDNVFTSVSVLRLGRSSFFLQLIPNQFLLQSHYLQTVDFKRSC